MEQTGDRDKARKTTDNTNRIPIDFGKIWRHGQGQENQRQRVTDRIHIGRSWNRQGDKDKDKKTTDRE